jgi:hypothetical protein
MSGMKMAISEGASAAGSGAISTTLFATSVKLASVSGWTDPSTVAALLGGMGTLLYAISHLYGYITKKAGPRWSEIEDRIKENRTYIATVFEEFRDVQTQATADIASKLASEQAERLAKASAELTEEQTVRIKGEFNALRDEFANRMDLLVGRLHTLPCASHSPTRHAAVDGESSPGEMPAFQKGVCK